MFKCGLLILTAPLSKIPQCISALLSASMKYVSETLYIHIEPGWKGGPSLANQKFGSFQCRPTVLIRNVTTGVYANAASTCGQLDVRVLLSSFTAKPAPHSQQTLRRAYDIILTDHKPHAGFAEQVLEKYPLAIIPSVQVLEANTSLGGCHTESADNLSTEDVPLGTYDYIALGGTFDRFHGGHKILLSEACLICDRFLTVGVTDGDMNAKKSLPELIQPTEERLAVVQDFLQDVKPSLEYDIVPIVDPYGPTIVRPEYQCLVVSQETVKGFHMVNQKREEKGMSPLEAHVIDLVEDTQHAPEEETKISSSSLRKRLLGTLWAEPKQKSGLPDQPYIIGLTGGIASGKSSVCRRLEALGAVIVDCDKLGHKAYVKGTETFHKVVEVFGEDIVGEDGEIDRRQLGGKVFKDKSQMDLLNSLVWPSIATLAKQQIMESSRQGKGVVVLDAAVLLEAQWDSFVHEVWVCIVPRDEAVKRLIDRNHLSEEQATQRIDLQMTNTDRVQRANVVLSTLWEYEVTQKQVKKAWGLLQSRLPGNI